MSELHKGRSLPDELRALRVNTEQMSDLANSKQQPELKYLLQKLTARLALCEQNARERAAFQGELRFVQFASYENHGPTIMVYTPAAWAQSEAGNNPGPIGFIPADKLPTSRPLAVPKEPSESPTIDAMCVRIVKPQAGEPHKTFIALDERGNEGYGNRLQEALKNLLDIRWAETGLGNG